jgi:hypothetical protein
VRKWRRNLRRALRREERLTRQGDCSRARHRARAKIGDYEGEEIGLREARRPREGPAHRGDRRARAATRSTRPAGSTASASSTTRATRTRFIRCTPARAEFYARRAIRKGEELTVDYGESQHNGTLPCRCGARTAAGFI